MIDMFTSPLDPGLVDGLTSVQAPLVDTPSSAYLTDEQEQVLIERARSGDRQARDEIIGHLLPRVERFAARYFYTYYWDASAMLSAQDLAQQASIVILERFSQAIEQARSLFGYLLAAAYSAIRCHSRRYCCPISTPDTSDIRSLSCQSLDAPLSAESDVTLLDVIAGDDGTARPEPGEVRDYRALYEAVESLTTQQRTVVVRGFGLYENAPEPLSEVAKDLGISALGGTKERALAKLYCLLATVYPQYCSQAYLQEPRPPAMQVRLSESQERRLEQAYAALQESCQKVTIHRLARTAGVNTMHANSYLSQQGYKRPGRQQRIEQAYAALQESCQTLSAQRLARAAGVSRTHAMLYLEQRRAESAAQSSGGDAV